MGNKVWYLAESEDSSYTDFTTMKTAAPVKNKKIHKASGNGKKNKKAGKVLLCLVGALAIAAGSVSGTWFYLTESNDEDSLDFWNSLIEDANDKIEEFCEDDSDDCESKDFSKRTNRHKHGSDPAYDVAEDIMSDLWGADDYDTAWNIFNWVHSNISYLPLTEELSYEDAAYRGFTRRTGDCYVYFSCAKMLLDCAGIPNLMVERYPVVTNGHYWNLVQIDGLWYHCDATVFRDHPDMYFMLTDDEICDEHHSFDGSLYPERAQSYIDYYGEDYNWYDDADYYVDEYFSDDYSDEDYYYWEDEEGYVEEWDW